MLILRIKVNGTVELTITGLPMESTVTSAFKVIRELRASSKVLARVWVAFTLY